MEKKKEKKKTGSQRFVCRTDLEYEECVHYYMPHNLYHHFCSTTTDVLLFFSFILAGNQTSRHKFNPLNISNQPKSNLYLIPFSIDLPVYI